MTKLTVDDLRVSIGGVPAVRGVSFELERGERVGLVGESGSGKTLTGLALLGLLPESATAAGQVHLDGVDVLPFGDREMSSLRGGRLGMVFQDPTSAMNPVMRVGRQVAEVIRLHERVDRAEAHRRAVELLERVQIPHARSKARAYPHELSGGQLQRAMIAMAIALSPDVVVADEPTSALDTTIQVEILALLGRLVDEEGIALLLITHDLAVVANVCERLLVLYGGQIVESGPTASVLSSPRHPYTHGLTRAVPGGDAANGRRHLPIVRGTVPALGHFPAGCPFRDRCPNAAGRCTEMPPQTPENERRFACWHPVGKPEPSR
jgi:peptide/nickel transport system ATP-binding protein